MVGCSGKTSRGGDIGAWGCDQQEEEAAARDLEGDHPGRGVSRYKCPEAGTIWGLGLKECAEFFRGPQEQREQRIGKGAWCQCEAVRDVAGIHCRASSPGSLGVEDGGERGGAGTWVS